VALGKLSGKAAAIAAGLVLWQAWSALRIAPYFLSYFNEAAGGPDKGAYWLTDSNVDWGQSLRELGQVLKDKNIGAVYLSYFGVADPHAEGIRYVDVGPDQFVLRSDDSVTLASPTWVAASVTYLNYRNHRLSWLNDLTPIQTIGHGIRLYDLSSRPDLLARVRGVTPPPTADAIWRR
jgi:hypothetical protein